MNMMLLPVVFHQVCIYYLVQIHLGLFLNAPTSTTQMQILGCIILCELEKQTMSYVTIPWFNNRDDPFMDHVR